MKNWFTVDLRDCAVRAGWAFLLIFIAGVIPVILRIVGFIIGFGVLFFVVSDLVHNISEWIRIKRHARELERLQIFRDVHDS